MKIFIGFIVLMITISLPTSMTLAEDIAPLTAAQDGYISLPKGKTILDSKTIKIGRNQTTCYRFENVSIPNNAVIDNANIQVPCKNCRNKNLRLRICGEYTGNAHVFQETDFNLIDRIWTRDCAFPVTGPDSNDSYDVGRVLQEIIRHPHWQSGNSAAFCFFDEGSRGNHLLLTNEAGQPAVLTATFMATGGGGSGSGLDCYLETNGDGFIDIFLDDTDNDGYCQFPTGTKDFFGTLILDKPFEIVGSNQAGGNGVTFRGSIIRVLEGSEVISDFQSDTVISNSGFSGLLLELRADSNLSVTTGAIISNLGSPTDYYDEAGDLYFGTNFLNGNITIDSPLILAEDITMESKGNIDIKGESMIGSLGNIHLKSMQSAGDFNITVSGQSFVFVSTGGSNRLSFTTASPTAEVRLTDNVTIIAPSINFCGVKGGINKIFIDSTVQIAGDQILPGDSRCGNPPP